jgi:N-methylhydantoinase A/oxoprolinase/acetone carboxylase beta subunit
MTGMPDIGTIAIDVGGTSTDITFRRRRHGRHVGREDLRLEHARAAHPGWTARWR